MHTKLHFSMKCLHGFATDFYLLVKRVNCFKKILRKKCEKFRIFLHFVRSRKMRQLTLKSVSQKYENFAKTEKKLLIML